MEATRGLPGYKDEYFRFTPKIVTTSMRSIVLASPYNAWRFSVDLETMATCHACLRGALYKVGAGPMF